METETADTEQMASNADASNADETKDAGCTSTLTQGHSDQLGLSASRRRGRPNKASQSRPSKELLADVSVLTEGNDPSKTDVDDARGNHGNVVSVDNDNTILAVTPCTRKKAGRPRKSGNLGSTSKTVADSDVIHSLEKKPGRPRKLELLAGTLAGADSFEDTSKTKQVQRSRKSENVQGDPPEALGKTLLTTDEYCEHDEDTQCPDILYSGKKRGRPSKYGMLQQRSLDADPVKATDEATPSTKTRGRSPLTEYKGKTSEMISASKDIDKVTPSGKRRGRPKKREAADEESPDSAFDGKDSFQVTSAGKKRGRPPRSKGGKSKRPRESDTDDDSRTLRMSDKSHSATDTATVARVSRLTPRSRRTPAKYGFERESTPEFPQFGRSKRCSKSPDNLDKGRNSSDFSDSVESDPDFEDESYKCGLKKKAKSQCRSTPLLSWKHKSKEVLKGPFTCAHCSEELDDSVKMAFHMLKEHYRVWRVGECPEGVVSLTNYFRQYKTLTCKQCNKEFRNATTYSNHVPWCGREHERKTCERCGSSVKGMWFPQHDRNCRRRHATFDQKQRESLPELVTTEGRKKRRAAKKAIETLHSLTDNANNNMEPGYDSEDSDDYKADKDDKSSSDSEDSGDFEDEALEPHTSSKKNKPFGSCPALMSRFSRQSEQWVQAPEIAMQRHKLLEGRSILSSWTPKTADWKILSTSEMEEYLPRERVSPSFRFSEQKHSSLKTTTSHKLTASKNAPENIKFSTSKEISDGWLSYTGGPVWSLAWCPVPTSTTAEQYLAIYSHNSMDVHTALDGSNEGNPCSVLQLWNCGQLSNTKSKNNVAPYLETSIAMNDGTVMDLKWCPYGGWKKVLRRMGLLSVAMSNGNIYIYSVPFLEDLLSRDGSRAHSIYKVKPTVIVSSILGIEARTMCMSHDWCVTEKGTKLAAGFSDGFVCVWDLETTSELLHRRDKEGALTVWPIRTIMAHVAPVTSVSFCGLLSLRIMTASHDKTMKLWDVSEPDWPLLTHSRSRLQDMHFMTFWPAFLIGADDCYNVAQNPIYVVDGTAASRGFNKTLSPHPCAVWSVSHDLWSHSMLSCDSMGTLAFMKLYPVCLSHLQRHKCMARDMVPLLVTNKVKYLEIWKEHPIQAKSKDHFLDYTAYKLMKEPSRVQEIDMEAENITETPVRALHKVAFNPNHLSHQWIAIAGQAGMLFIRHVTTT